MGNIVFVTGTDTAAGKTLVTALLLLHLRSHGCHALAMKPFSSGGLHDAKVLFDAQDREIPLEVINPFRFEEPLAPLAAARREGRLVPQHEVLRKIRQQAHRCDLLLVEGAGGLLVPLGERYTVADLIRALRCPVVLVARNKLGAINHTLLSLALLRRLRAPEISIVLTNSKNGGCAAQTNCQIIAEFAEPTSVIRIPYLGADITARGRLRTAAKKMKKTLAALLGMRIFRIALRGDCVKEL